MTQNRKQCITRTLCIAAASLGLCIGTAYAQSSPYFVGGALTYSHDSNLLRLPDGAPTPTGATRADSAFSTALLAGLDQYFGRQHASGNLTLRSNKYSSNSIYNNDSYAFTGTLDWSSVERLSGQVSANASRSLSSFNLQEIGLLTEKNQESSQSLDAMVRMGLVTEYSVEASAGYREIKNSLNNILVQARNYKQDTASVGLQWRPSPDLTLGLALRDTRGIYPKYYLPQGSTDYEADRFKRQNLDLSLIYRASGASSLDLRLSSGKTTYDLATKRNFSGLTGSLGWNWVVTPKVNLYTRLSHETGQDSYAVTTFFGLTGTADYSRVNTALAIKADYAVLPKVALNLAVYASDRDLVRTFNESSTSEATGRERYNTVSLGVRWAALRSVQVGCDVGQNTRQGSGVLGSDLKATTYSCFGQFTLQ